MGHINLLLWVLFEQQMCFIHTNVTCKMCKTELGLMTLT